jgi:hypothetical protein
VVVAVSGGGIVAATWTSICLTELERRYAGFPSHVRIISGASGGMVGAAYYAATLLRTPVGRRTEDDRRAIVENISKDSLTAPVSQLLLSDLPRTFWPRRQSWDRGRVLEAEWEKNSGRDLAHTFRDLAAAEADGKVPSLIISPTVIEEGSPLLISNLDLATVRGGMEFFKLFPRARGLRLSTAVRMNAAFPYVTPATSLPTIPPLRPVDAGYYDNYGVTLAAEWMTRGNDEAWSKLLEGNTSGIVLIQIRAYPLGAAERRGPLSWIADGAQGLTSPVEGYTTVYKKAMLSRNQGKIDELEGYFGSTRDGVTPFFSSFVLQCEEERLESSILRPSNQDQLGKIIELIR